MTKQEFIKFEAMCRWEDCEELGCGLIMGTLYCSKHLQAADIIWEKRQTCSCHTETAVDPSDGPTNWCSIHG